MQGYRTLAPSVFGYDWHCGWTNKEQQYGDILVAEAAYDYGSGKIAETDNGRVFTPSHTQLRIDPELHPLLQQWERDQPRMDVIRRAWPTPLYQNSETHCRLAGFGSSRCARPDARR